MLVTDRIIKDLRATGKFFDTPEGAFYFMEGENPRLFSIGMDVALAAIIHDRYGINPAEEREFKHIIKALEIEAEQRGEKTTVRRLFHYDLENRSLYVSRFDGKMYRLDGETITEIPNGADGVFFWDDPSWEPYEPVPGPQGRGLFVNSIIRSANFCESGDLQRSDQQWIFFVWCIAQFFGSLHPTKPLLLISGEKGGGKTLCLRKWLKLLFGSSGNVTGLERGKPDGFVAAVCSSPIVVFDNVDEHVGWLPDHLAQLATGIKFKRRKLYTTNESVEFQPQCFVALTARTSKFINGRDDVLDRTLVLHTDRRQEFSPENDQLQTIAANRNGLWCELLRCLNRIVGYLKGNENHAPKIEFRMADFAAFALSIARFEGREEVARSILKKMDSERTDILLADEPIAAYLDKWLEDAQNHNRKVNTAELNKELSWLAAGMSMPPWPYNSAHSLGQRLSNITTNLRQRLDVKVERDSSNQCWYRFAPRLKR
jgi:hypothetical protein